MKSWRQWIVRRNLIGSDVAIVLTCFYHFYEGVSLLITTNANGSVGLAALIVVFRWPSLIAVILSICAAAAISAEWQPELSREARLALLMPQLGLLIIEAVWAIHLASVQHYADTLPSGYVIAVWRPWNFIFSDQMPRIGMPIWYGSALIARVRD